MLWENVLPSLSYLFSQFLRAGTLCWKNIALFAADGWEFLTFLRHCSYFRELGKQVMNIREKLWEYEEKIDNYSNRIGILIKIFSHVKKLLKYYTILLIGGVKKISRIKSRPFNFHLTFQCRLILWKFHLLFASGWERRK